MKRLILPLMLLLMVSCSKEEALKSSNHLRPTGYSHISIDCDSMTEVHDSATLGEMDSATYWEWYHLLFGYDLDFTRGDTSLTSSKHAR